MRTLLDLLADMPRLGDREAVRFYNGFRTWELSYRQLYSRIAAFADHLKQEGLKKGDRVLLWGDNRIQWLTAFWGCLARGVEVVPADARSSDKLVRRIQKEVGAKFLVYGEGVETEQFELEKLSFNQVEKLPTIDHLEIADIAPSDVVEIVYTSGTTGEPKGIVHRHKNICANLRPFQVEIQRYRNWARPFQPIRILDLLPLSHMYGQSLGMFIPLVLEGAAVFMPDFNPSAIMEAIRRERVCVLVAVPRLVKNLQNEIERRFEPPVKEIKRTGITGTVARWWRYRHVHSAFGWKFWSIVVGGAQLDPESEDFWNRRGFLVLQGYGLTETSPVVTVNHPFDAQRGSIGKVLEGQEVKIADDGEILVRGESVVSEYLGNVEEETRVSQSGWLHTGDLGEIDQEGRLYYKGRKKEVIVTAEGLNVYPRDVESALNRFPQIQDSAVIGLHKDDVEVVHAALLLKDASTDPESVIRRANRELEHHQRIRSWSIWPDEDFPRTSSTLKIKRSLVAQRVGASLRATTPLAKTQGGCVENILSQMTGKALSELDENLTLDEDLGLSSLEKVDLLSQLQNRLGVDLDEERLTQLSTIGEVQAWIKEEREDAQRETSLRGSSTPSWRRRPFLQEGFVRDEQEPHVMPTLPRWTWLLPVRWLRMLSLQLIILPMFRRYIKHKVDGLEYLERADPPLIFAANHVSHLDTAAIFSALPAFWRWRLAPAMGVEFFQAYFQPRSFSSKERLIAATQYFLAIALFNACPFSQHMKGIRPTLKYTGELIDRGYCPLVYPEGKRSPDGDLQPFKTGIGYMAVRLQAVVVPIYLRGLYEIYSIHHEWPQAGEVLLRIGSPLSFDPGRDYKEVTETIEEAIRKLKEGP